jgi:YbgC/YbaW family acyl-CoA thioester hydrolase
MVLNKTKFTTDIILRPDDIDLNNHLHSSKYMDYVLYARYDQMERCYGFSMEDFIKAGFGWVMTDSFMQFKRPLSLNDKAQVTTWVEDFNKNIVEVHFTISNKKTGKLSCNGWFKYSMVALDTMRAAAIPEEIVMKYTI